MLNSSDPKSHSLLRGVHIAHKLMGMAGCFGHITQRNAIFVQFSLAGLQLAQCANGHKEFALMVANFAWVNFLHKSTIFID